MEEKGCWVMIINWRACFVQKGYNFGGTCLGSEGNFDR